MVKTMAIEITNVQKPFRKLRKSLKNLPKDPSPDDVHNLRTQTRRIEAIVAALTPDQADKARRLLKAVTPVRKAAGDVRDMDVLVSNSMTLSNGRGDDSVVRLVEHLGGIRMDSARKLVDTVAQQRKSARRTLKQYSKMVENRLRAKKRGGRPGCITGRPPVDAVAVTLNLIAELNQWPKLTAQNIHPFRLKVKELRYILQLADNPDTQLVEALGEVKDQIGDWHDWQELCRIANQVLNPNEDRPLLKRLDEIEKKKLAQALARANAMRTRYLANKAVTGSGKQLQIVPFKEPVVKSAVRLAG
jgi:CHAD domain-containing protein